MTSERTATINALIVLLRIVELGIGARKALTGTQLVTVSRYRARDEDLHLATSRSEAISLAKRVVELDEQFAANASRITELGKPSQAAPLLEKTGFGPVTAAVCLIVWPHRGRVRSEPSYCRRSSAMRARTQAIPRSRAAHCATESPAAA